MSETKRQSSKTLGQKDLVLFSISAILLLDTLASGAVLGPSIVFWWLLLGAILFVPNALIVAELGSAFPEQGGIYAWVREAFGRRWSSRITWSYWINCVVWLPSLFILFSGVLSQLFFPDMGLLWQIGLGIVLTWLTVLLNVIALNIGKWVPNLGTVFKIYYLCRHYCRRFYTGNESW